MSIVIVGGNECMERRYKDICEEYNCSAKVYSKMSSNMKKLGNPDLLVLFTNTMSHKMLECTLKIAKNSNLPIVRSHTSSATALKNILSEHIA